MVFCNDVCPKEWDAFVAVTILILIDGFLQWHTEEFIDEIMAESQSLF